MIPNKISIDGSQGRVKLWAWVGWCVRAVQVEVACEAGDDAGVPGDLGVPAARLGVVVELVDVGELVGDRGDELDCGGEVLARFADVGVGACFDHEVA